MAVMTMVDLIGHVSPRQPNAFKLISALVAAAAISFTSIQYYQTRLEPPRQPDPESSLFHDGLPSKIVSDSSLPFDSGGRFQIDGTVTNVALSYVDAVHIDTYEQAIMLEVSRTDRQFNDGRDLRLIVSNGGKFMESRPKRGRSSILLKPAILATLCGHLLPPSSASCSLTLTVIADSGSPLGDPMDFVLSGIVAPIIRHDRPKSLFLPAGRLTQVAIQIQAPGADIAADGSAQHPIYLSAISEFDLRNDGLGPALISKPDVPADHYSLRIAKDFHIVLIRSESDSLVTIEARSLPAAVPIVWNWSLFARTLLLAIFIFCLLAPTILLFVANRPSRSASIEIQTQASNAGSSSSRNDLEEMRLKNMTVLAAIPLKRFGDNFHTTNSQCSICLEVYKVDDLVRDLVCAHRFHYECCDSWIIEKGHCPLCLQEIGCAVNYHAHSASDQKQHVLRRTSISA